MARCTVERLMRAMGLQGVVRGKPVENDGERQGGALPARQGQSAVPGAAPECAVGVGFHLCRHLGRLRLRRLRHRHIRAKDRRKRLDFSLLRTGEGHPLADRLRAELEREYARLDLINTQLRAVEAERDTADAQDIAVERKRNMLLQLRGIGPASAAILAREIFGRSFANRRQLGSYLGLGPSAYDSGSGHPMPRHFQGRQQFCASRHDRGRLAVAPISTGNPPPRCLGRACRIVASRHGAAGYKLMRQAHARTRVHRSRDPFDRGATPSGSATRGAPPAGSSRELRPICADRC